MTKYILAGVLALTSTSAFAGVPPMYEVVPEMSAGPAVAAIALLVGVAAIIREKSKRK